MFLVGLQKAFDTLDYIVLLPSLFILRSKTLNGFNHISPTENFCDTR